MIFALENILNSLAAVLKEFQPKPAGNRFSLFFYFLYALNYRRPARQTIYT